jgi:hypothetical protein
MARPIAQRNPKISPSGRRATPTRPAFRRSSAVSFLSAAIGVLALVAAGLGLFWTSGEAPATFATLRGQTVALFGHGIYRFDTLFIGAGNHGTDATTLLLGIPALAVTTLLYRRGSLRGALVHVGILAYFLYVYLTYAVGVAYNELFLVYVAIFSASFFAFVLAMLSFDLEALAGRLSPTVSRRGPAAFMFFAALLTTFVWLEPIVTGLTSGAAPVLLDSYSTFVTYALDLAVITPTLVLSGYLILRRQTLGYLLTFPTLVILIMLFPAISAQTAFQVTAGVQFTTPEIVGPIGGFLVASLGAVWVLVNVLRGFSTPATDRAPR